jgi:hypothetical protein
LVPAASAHARLSACDGPSAAAAAAARVACTWASARMRTAWCCSPVLLPGGSGLFGAVLSHVILGPRGTGHLIRAYDSCPGTILSVIVYWRFEYWVIP